jgi:hypothetical protein
VDEATLETTTHPLQDQRAEQELLLLGEVEGHGDGADELVEEEDELVERGRRALK